ncbi:hypothetical protein DevBK_11375 [Devosia sp. BK]|uniref:hypothetical protein n=1 Tax=Devosia sp. BK TaxID=2871706 RepID=UPI00293A505B|nr:hypothetical protein [Devosia sp. BK]MDV3251934.1 hypothetical protein [Devosia sp. BK]
MSIGGPQALASLEEAMRDIRREEDEISRRLARSSEVIAKVKESEAELFRQLAQLRLDPSIQRELDGRISSAEVRARETLKTHGKAIEGAQKTLDGFEAGRVSLIERRANAVAVLAEKQQALDALLREVAVRLEADPAYIEKRKAAAALAEIADQSLDKTKQAEADREEKGKPYRDDPLFIYLWDNGFGTSAYRGGNLTRYLDGLVAGLVGFAKARPNYAMLNDIPLRLREHAERQSAGAEAAEAELAAFADAAADAAGGKPLREARAKAQADVDAIDAAIVEAEDKRDAAAQSLQELNGSDNPVLSSAAAALAAALGQEDIQTLLAEARRTRTGQDDTIVAQIDDARTRMREEEEESRDLRDRARTLAARRRELEDIQWEFKKQRFDDPRSTFREDRLVGDLLNDFLRGGISAASYWDQWRKSQNWAPGSEWGAGNSSSRQGGSPWEGGGGFNWPDNSFGGGGGSSGNRKPRAPGGFGGGWSGGGSSSGGGFSRPRTGSAGTRKHGGFKTGGGF